MQESVEGPTLILQRETRCRGPWDYIVDNLVDGLIPVTSRALRAGRWQKDDEGQQRVFVCSTVAPALGCRDPSGKLLAN